MKKIFLVFLLLSLFLLSGCVDYEKKYEALQEKYDDLELKYDKISSWYIEDKEKIGPYFDSMYEDIGSLEDELATVSCYFEKEEYVTFDEAYNAFETIDKVLHEYIY